jgi:hypothetical protein
MTQQNNSNANATGAAKAPMTAEAAARIQSATAKANGGQVPANSFAARAQQAAARHGGGKK